MTEASNEPDYDPQERGVIMERDRWRIAKALGVFDYIVEQGYTPKVAAELTNGVMITDMLAGILVELGELRGREIPEMDFPDGELNVRDGGLLDE